MGIFSSKKKKTESKKAAVTPKASTTSATPMGADVLLRPRITEKATSLSANNVYTFEVSPKATAYEVARAVKSLYGVTAEKVSMLPIRSKRTFAKGRRGRTSGGKKAYVFLKKGDVIQFV